MWISQVIDGNRKFDAQLAETAEQISLLGDDKADKTALQVTNANLALKANIADVNNQIAAVTSGSPKGVYSTVSALQAAFPTGNTNIYVVTADGNWYYWNGAAWTVGGTYQSTGLAEKSVTYPRLATNYNYAGVLSTENLDTITNTGTYITVGATFIRPPDAHTTALLHVWSNDAGTYCTQLYQDIDGNIYSRIRTLNYGGFGEWTSLKNELFDRSVTNTKLALNYNYSGALDETDDLDAFTNTGTYITTGATVNRPNGAGTTALLHVWSNDAGTYCTQFYQDINSIIYSRIKSLNYGSFTGWTPVNKPLGGKIIVNFGDSIVGNFEAPSSVSAYIASKTGATVYNVGFGGCRMSAHYGYWDAFSMYRLADAVATGDFSLQDQALIDDTSNEMPAYFDAHLATLKGIDFNAVDYITISYGTNDWFNDDTGMDDTNPLERWTFKGALRYTLE